MYKKVDSGMGFADREAEVIKFWKERDIYKKQTSMSRQDGKPYFTIYDGPPTANGKPHIGHILTRAVKDIYPRYYAMKGYNVMFKAGWDTHGLPVELEVEKMLGIDGKPEIEAYGIEPFIEKCKESVWTYKDEWEEMSNRVGYWADMENPYVTYENKYIESEWWALKKIWEKGLLYEGHKIVPYCPRCGTALSSHEVAQGYKDVKDNSVFVRMKVKGHENRYLAVWTTTPWTLPSNVACCVNPDEEYLLIEAEGFSGTGAEHTDKAEYYVAKQLAETCFGENFKSISEMKGRELEGLQYEPLFHYGDKTISESGKRAYIVVSDSYVTMSDGTGIVHIAPAFGEDDSRIGRDKKLTMLQLVNTRGEMTDDCEDIAGMFVKDADPVIINKLRDKGLLLKVLSFEHSYPFCWRCDTPLIYYARYSWFIQMTKLRDELVSNNREVNWYPPSIGTGRFGNFLENVVDWSLSRERYWGTPLPVWECASCGKQHVVGSIEELRSMSDDCPEDIELHRPYIDKVHLKCPDCGALMTRRTEVIDCWFDSGAMPFAQLHYPFENSDIFEKRFPATFISEALDQTRGWFYSLIAISTCLFGKASYKNCEVLGLVQDKDGQKMSKHKGNVVDPWEVLNNQGADAVRWYFYSASNPWLPSRFSFDAVEEHQRKFMGTLWNVYAFYVLYADIDKFDPRGLTLDRSSLSQMDRWILSLLQSLIVKVDKSLASFDITAGARAMASFVDKLSNWYVRRSRERFWAGKMDSDKQNAFLTLYTVLESLAKLAAPFVPFITEMIYQNIVRGIDPDAPESVHLCEFPKPDESLVDTELESEMEAVLTLVTLGRAARNKSGIKNRQALSEMIVIGDIEIPSCKELIEEELNVRKIVKAENAEKLTDYIVKPQLRTLGRRLGGKLPLLNAYLREADGNALVSDLKREGRISVELEGQTVLLEEEDLIISEQEAEGYSSASEHGITVAVDLKLTPELIDAGLVREMVSKIQTMRREAEFDVTDRVILYYDSDETINRILNEKGDELAAEVLATAICGFSDEKTRGEAETVKEWDVNGHKCRFGLRRDKA